MSKFVSGILRWSNCCAMLLLGGSLLGLYAPPSVFAAEAERGTSCLSCHEQAVLSFNASFHSKIWKGENDCQACHGSTDQHIGDQSKTTIISFSKNGGRTAEELNKQCLGCHTQSANLALWDMGAHKKNDVACISCHDIHQPRSTVKQPDVCFSCHKDIRSDANKISHHPIIEGKVKCSDCHNTHGTQAKHMLNAENTNQLCYKCHADKRGPNIWEHPPVEENCLICHSPHGSRHESLLVEKVVNLCQDCHDDSSHHGAAYDTSTAFAGSAAVSVKDRFVARACLECHHDIHGSASFRRSLSR
ncbi:MAG: DmsE family decaheme c-type cytochrome [Desulfocapsaceae bacterium]|nr:DmsE family decaheme c-type cytochrome [Desulfocapsaceae bacterium]